MTDQRLRREWSDETLERLRTLVKEVASESNRAKIQALFEEIRNLLRIQLDETKRRIMRSGKSPTELSLRRSGSTATVPRKR